MSIRRDVNKYKPRKEQQECLDFIDSNYKKNPQDKIYLLDLPVGVGKSHLAMMISQWYFDNVNRMARVDVITNSKILQDQYSSTYNSIQDLKGKDNYECKEYGCSCAQGAEFNKLNKTKCDDCPYQYARESFINGKISLTNFYLYVLYALYIPKVLENRAASVLIVDEAHSFDEVMSNFISVKITEKTIKKMKLTDERKMLSELKSVKTISEYIKFLKKLEKTISNSMNDITRSMMGKSRSITKDKRSVKLSVISEKGPNSDVKMMNLISDLDQLKSKIEIFLKEYENDPDNWILESNWNEKTKKVELSLEPIWAYEYLDKYVFSKYDMVFLMSGTILNKSLFCEINGLDVDRSVYYSIDSPFEVSKRPLFYMPLGKMSYKQKETTFKNYIPYLHKILKKYNDKKGIIHTNSFELSKWIEDSVKDDRLMFHDSSNKDQVLNEHYDSIKPSVIVSPSMDTGVSFDDDKARFQIIAKVPYPTLASKKNKMRQKMKPDWYIWRTVSGLIQMTGRAVRSVDDHADTIIIDGGFGDVMRYSSHFLPKWFQKAIRSVNIKTKV